MADYPVVRISREHFAPTQYNEVQQLAEESAIPLVPAIKRLQRVIQQDLFPQFLHFFTLSL